MDAILNPTTEFFFFEEQPIIDKNEGKKISMWISDQDIVRPSTNILLKEKLDPGMYLVDANRDLGVFCKKISFCSDKLFLFSNSIINSLVDEINIFWSKTDIYKTNNLIHKRGILLEGVPGTGKTSLISLLSNEIISKGGVVFKLDGQKNIIPYVSFIKDSFRKIQPDTPIITIIEDIDEFDEYLPELLDFLDGKNHIEHHVILSTSNNTEEIDDTLLRPSRIDLRIEIGLPDKTVRREYFKFKNVPEDILDELVSKSKDLSIADLKEVYICIFLLDYSIEDAFNKVLNVKEKRNYLDKRSKVSSLSI